MGYIYVRMYVVLMDLYKVTLLLTSTLFHFGINVFNELSISSIRFNNIYVIIVYEKIL